MAATSFLGESDGVHALVFYVGGALLAWKLGSLLYSFLLAIYAAFLRGGVLVTKYGKWAVITGATDGIGKAYAVELAKKKMNIVLVSRTQSKLDEVAKDISSRFNVEVKTVQADFSTYGNEVYEKLEQALQGLDIGVLVNNVGISYDYPEYFLALPDSRVDALIQLNVVATVRVTKIVLPGMVERKKGAIVNISSGSGTIVCPLLSAYSASKAFVDNFSQSLQAEYASKGIVVQSLVPFFVVSNMTKMRKSFTTPDAATFARQALATLGHDGKTAGFWPHNLMHFVLQSLPPWLVASKVLAMHKDLKVRAVRKLEKQAKKD